MKKIDLNQSNSISAGISSLLHIHACQVVMDTWHQNYMTCRVINHALNNLAYYSLLNANSVEHLRSKFPPHLQICPDFDTYLQANPEYQSFCS